MRPAGDYFWWLVTQTLYRRHFAQLGSRSIMRAPLILLGRGRISLGNRCMIREGARIELVTQYEGRTFEPELIIGENTSFEQGCHITCAQRIEIGTGVAITERVGIFDILHGYETIGIPIRQQPLRTAPVKIGDNTLVGMGAVIQPGVTIGRHCVIGANSVVTREIPDYSVAVGAPARVIRRYDSVQRRWCRTDVPGQ